MGLIMMIAGLFEPSFFYVLKLRFHTECKLFKSYYSILCFIMIITWAADLTFKTINPHSVYLCAHFPGI